MQLSVLDQSPIPAGSSSAQALQNTIDLARLTDSLGYSRYWIAEHHGRALASPSPEVLLARIGAETTTMRIGSGGVMLPHYAPMKVAENFSVLHALYGNRIDLGIGRAPGTEQLASHALRRDRRMAEADDFPQQLVELLAFLRRDFPSNHPFARIHVAPDMPGGPDVWLLGSSLWSAEAAAQLGLPYAFAHFIGPQATRDAIAHYRAHFRPGVIQEPHAMIALGVICADSEDEAKRLRLSSRLMRRRLRQGIILPIPSPEDAYAELGNRDEAPEEGAEWPRYTYGTPAQVREKLSRIAEQLGLDEIMALTVVHDHAARRRSYELLAGAFDVAPSSTPRE